MTVLLLLLNLLEAVFPGEGRRPRVLLCAVPFHRGWSAKGAADFDSTTITVWEAFLEKNRQQLGTIGAKKEGLL